MKKNILVVDDDFFIRSLLFLLLKEKYNVTIAENGFNAILLLEGGVFPDIIITDVDMPQIDGFHFLKHLKKSGYYRDIPTIVLTGHEGPEIREKLKECGATDYITKPFNPPQLLTLLSNLIYQNEIAS